MLALRSELFSGENNPMAKLTNSETEEIKTKWLSGEYTREQIHEQYGCVSESRICRIIHQLDKEMKLTRQERFWRNKKNTDTKKDMIVHKINTEHNQVGENNSNAKLTDAQVEEIREKYATGLFFQKDLAKEYGVSSSLVSFIVNPNRNFRKKK